MPKTLDARVEELSHIGENSNSEIEAGLLKDDDKIYSRLVNYFNKSSTTNGRKIEVMPLYIRASFPLEKKEKYYGVEIEERIKQINVTLEMVLPLISLGRRINKEDYIRVLQEKVHEEFRVPAVFLESSVGDEIYIAAGPISFIPSIEEIKQDGTEAHIFPDTSAALHQIVAKYNRCSFCKEKSPLKTIAYGFASSYYATINNDTESQNNGTESQNNGTNPQFVYVIHLFDFYGSFHDVREPPPTKSHEISSRVYKTIKRLLMSELNIE